MAFSDGFSYLKGIYVDTTIFQLDWVISIFLVFLTMLIITREVPKWKALAFPVTIAWHVAGVTPSFLWYFATAIVFVIDMLSTEIISSAIGTITGTAKTIQEGQQDNIESIPILGRMVKGARQVNYDRRLSEQKKLANEKGLARALTLDATKDHRRKKVKLAKSTGKFIDLNALKEELEKARKKALGIRKPKKR